MKLNRGVWLNARKYKPSDIEDYKDGEFLSIRVIYPRKREYDIVTGWYNSVKGKFIIPEQYLNHRYYNIKDFCVLPKLKW